MLTWETFSTLTRLAPGLDHAFSLRSPHPDEELHGYLHPSIKTHPWHGAIIEAEQPHGNRVALVGLAESGTTIPGVDALITSTPGITLAIRVADCAPIYLFDPVKRAFGIIHSGKKGTSLNILTATVEALTAECQSNPANLIGFIGPCIRPPNYEIDFAAEIVAQAQRAGVGTFHDSCIDTASHLDRYYSYRAEKGKTGRMWAVASLTLTHTLK